MTKRNNEDDILQLDQNMEAVPSDTKKTKTVDPADQLEKLIEKNKKNMLLEFQLQFGVLVKRTRKSIELPWRKWKPICQHGNLLPEKSCCKDDEQIQALHDLAIEHAEFLDTLVSSNKTPLTQQYRIHPTMNCLQRRTRKNEESEWLQWYRGCKHGKYQKNCDYCKNGEKPERAKSKRHIIDEPLLITDLEKLQHQYADDENVEFKLKKSMLYRRGKSNGKWTKWWKCCKHGLGIYRCCGREFTPEEAEARRVEKLQKLSNGDTEHTGNYRRQESLNSYAKLRYMTPDEKIEYKTQKRRGELLERSLRIQELITQGYTDFRCPDSKCRICEKTLIPSEKVDYILREDEVFSNCVLTQKDKRVMWTYICVTCGKESRKNGRDDGACFKNRIAKSLCFHIDEPTERLRIVLDEILTKGNGKCTCCGVEVLLLSKSGWKQCSINDRHPDIRHANITLENGEVETVRTNTHINDLSVSCLACNRFQNSLPWTQSLAALDIIAHGPYPEDPTSRAPLTADEHRFARVNGGKQGCPVKIKMQVIEKCGRHCYYTGTPLVLRANDPFTASYDRLDSKKPYTVDQTNLVSKYINFVKLKSITEDELKAWIQHLRDNKDFIRANYLRSSSDVGTVVAPK